MVTVARPRRDFTGFPLLTPETWQGLDRLSTTGTMTTRLILLAHGETDATRGAAFADGEGLNARGRDAARERLTALRGYAEVLTSPARAARQTAAASDAHAVLKDAVLKDAVLKDAVLKDAVLKDAVLKDAVLKDAVLKDAVIEDAVIEDAVVEKAVVDDALRDIDVGAWRGRTLADVAARDPVAAAAWIADPSFDAHGGEPIERVIARMARWLPTRHARQGTTLAVTHAAVLRASVVALLDAPPSAFWLVDVRPLSALALTSDGRRWAMRSLT